MIPKFRVHDKRTNKLFIVEEINYNTGFEGVYFDIENEHQYRHFDIVVEIIGNIHEHPHLLEEE